MNIEKFHYGVFDIESEKWIYFKLLGFYDGSEYKVFRSIHGFLNHINHRKYRGWKFYAHNGGRFDFLFLLYDIIMKLGWQVKLIPRGSSVISIMVKTSKTEFTFCDSFAILPESLKKLTEAFNVEHKKKEFKFDESTVIDTHDPVILDYLKNDVIGLYEVIGTFFSQDFIDHPKITIASQGLDIFRSRFFKGELLELPIKMETDFRENYYSGGRVEVYKSYGKKVNVYDVNSLFSFAMLRPMPVGDVYKTKSFHKDKIGFYKVRIKSTPSWYISPLLTKIRNKDYRKNGNYYVNGPGEYFVSSEMIKYLKSEFGVNCEIIQGYFFDGQEYLFQDYVNYFYELKSKNKGTAQYTIAKFLLNCLYGKLGMNRERESIQTFDGTQQNFSTLEGYEKWLLVLVSEETKSRFILPYLAAYITDLARLHHYKYMNEHPESIYYCDTDSLFTDVEYPVNDNIGGLKNEGTYEAVFLAPKTYALNIDGKEEEIAFKGFDTTSFKFRDFKTALIDGTELKAQRKSRILSFKENVGKSKRKTGIIAETSPFLKTVMSEKESNFSKKMREFFPSKKYINDSKPYLYSTVFNNLNVNPNQLNLEV